MNITQDKAFGYDLLIIALKVENDVVPVSGYLPMEILQKPYFSNAFLSKICSNPLNITVPRLGIHNVFVFSLTSHQGLCS